MTYLLVTIDVCSLKCAPHLKASSRSFELLSPHACESAADLARLSQSQTTKARISINLTQPPLLEVMSKSHQELWYVPLKRVRQQRLLRGRDATTVTEGVSAEERLVQVDTLAELDTPMGEDTYLSILAPRPALTYQQRSLRRWNKTNDALDMSPTEQTNIIFRQDQIQSLMFSRATCVSRLKNKTIQTLLKLFFFFFFTIN